MKDDELLVGGAKRQKRTKRSKSSAHDRMNELFTLGHYTDALAVAEGILAKNVEDVEAQGTRRRARAELMKMYQSKFGADDECPEVRMTAEDLVWLNMTSTEAGVLARIDGNTPVRDLLPEAEGERLDVARFLARLAEQGAIGVKGRK